MANTLLLNKAKKGQGHTVTNSQILDKLAKQIRSRYEATTRLVKTAQDRSREAVAEAILCGKALNEAKAIVGHGGWGKWLGKHCKGVEQRTCQRYMTLAKASHVTDLKQPGSLRQAYITVGILNDSDPETSATRTTNVSPSPSCLDLTAPSLSAPVTDLTIALPSTARQPRTTTAQLIADLKQRTLSLSIDSNNYIKSKRLTIEQARAATLQPLQAFFDALESKQAA